MADPPQPPPVPAPPALVPRFRARDPPVFSASPTEDVTDWVERYVQATVFNQWTPEQQLEYVGMFLEGVARNWYQNLPQRPVTFEEFRQRVIQDFRNPNYRMMIDAQLRSRVQGLEEPAVNYCHEVLTLCTKLDPNMQDAIKIQHMLKGLRPTIMQRVFSFVTHESTAQEILGRVRLESQSDMLVQASNWMSSNPSTPQMSIMTDNFQQTGPSPSANVSQVDLVKFKDEIKKEAESSVQALKNELLEEMQGLKRALKRTSTTTWNENEGMERPSRTEDGRPICYGCRRPGHILRNCSNRRGSESPPPAKKSDREKGSPKASTSSK